MNSPFRIALFVIPYSLFLILVSAPTVHAEITRTLQIGSTGPDVKELQVILNSDPLTAISSSGIGSPGKESEYFGVLTKKAVEAFQKKYAPEVLFPAGIWQPTGIVGQYSRTKLNAVAKANIGLKTTTFSTLLPSEAKSAIPSSSQGKVSGTISDSSSVFSLFSTKNKPLIFNLSRYEAKRGDTVTVRGGNFLSANNSVVLDGEHRIDGIPSPSGTSLSFVVPNSMQNGSYNLSIENANGSSFTDSFGNYFTVTDSPSSPPKVISVSPKTILYSASSNITISGEGFSTKGNDVFTDFGTATNIMSSDGKSLTLTLSAFSGFAQAGAQASVFSKAKVSVPVYVVVKNSAGISSERVSFLLQY